MTAARVAGKVVSWTALLLCLTTLVGAIWWVADGKNDDGANILGFRPYLVATGSMEPGYRVHGLVLTRATSFDEVKAGDVVAFRANAMNGAPALHRVIDITRGPAGQPVTLTVKGDNNPLPDGSPVTRANYLGTAVFHTNLTATVWNQAHQPHGLIRVVLLPAAAVVLVWLGVRLLQDRRRSVLGTTAVVVLVSFCLLASAAGSYALYLDRTQEHLTSTLAGAAQRFEREPARQSFTVADTTVNGTIDIPRIDVHYPVIDYVAATSLNLGITHFAGPGLNQPGNVVLAGHRAWGNLFFTRIDQLQQGDLIRLTDSRHTRVEYVVVGHRQVTPQNTSVLAQPTDGKRHLTLIACTYDLRNRYIVDAIASHDMPQRPVVAARPVLAPSQAGLLPAGAVPVAAVLVVLGIGIAVARSAFTRRPGGGHAYRHDAQPAASRGRARVFRRPDA